ncbi:hypothetical protein LOK49_LG11G00172 [Camellia lanceoleosa]|uniref:Uncharacterized protein n=1 Tax=Camellia lanceoleosa TaxID=1840588 RepID=A0ACC0G1T1_9ERIC|nr:hypothetical protein LOK49_LG11G00172 [Camellia lanceoleosa]
MIKPYEASRVLNEKEENLLSLSLRVPVPPWGPNPPTYIPTPSIKASTINQKSFAGQVMPPPKAEVRIKKENSFLRSMKRGPVPSKGPDPPTYSPPPSIKASTINQKSFAGHVMSPPEAEGRIKKENSFLHSVKRSPAPSTGPNPPTYIPPPSMKASTISQKNFAGHVMPPPETEKWIKKENNLLRSMKRSPVPSKGPYPPTYIPPPNIKASTISQKNFVGHAMPPPEVEERIKKENNLLRSMRRSPVPLFGPNPFTYIPTPSIKASTISQKSFARSFVWVIFCESTHY